MSGDDRLRRIPEKIFNCRKLLCCWLFVVSRHWILDLILMAEIECFLAYLKPGKHTNICRIFVRSEPLNIALQEIAINALNRSDWRFSVSFDNP